MSRCLAQMYAPSETCVQPSHGILEQCACFNVVFKQYTIRKNVQYQNMSVLLMRAKKMMTTGGHPVTITDQSSFVNYFVLIGGLQSEFTVVDTSTLVSSRRECISLSGCLSNFFPFSFFGLESTHL